MTGPIRALIALPSPISTNHLYSNVPGVGRVATKRYRAWKKVAKHYLVCQRPLPVFKHPVSIRVMVGELTVGEMDSDNTLKAYLDILKWAEVIKDDNRKWVRKAQAAWVPEMTGAVAVIDVVQNEISAARVIEQLPRNGRELLAV